MLSPARCRCLEIDARRDRGTRVIKSVLACAAFDRAADAATEELEDIVAGTAGQVFDIDKRYRI
jgi:hypothetical protein